VSLPQLLYPAGQSVLVYDHSRALTSSVVMPPRLTLGLAAEWEILVSWRPLLLHVVSLVYAASQEHSLDEQERMQV